MQSCRTILNIGLIMADNYLALFPGQGSQKVGMGKELYAESEIARHFFDRAQKALGFNLGKICFEGPEEALTSTAVAQPAILTVSSICFEIAKEKKLNFSCSAGHSLGEYSALVAAAALSYEDAVLLVHKRGTYMQEAVPVGSGKMLAILGKEVSEIEGAIAQLEDGVAQIANDNAPGQIVVAGDNAGIDNLQKVMAGAKMIELKVSAPFHCALMREAELALRKDLSSLNILQPQFPVISNYYAKQLTTVEEIREALALQVCARVRWVESMQYALNHFKCAAAIEFGTGAVLSGLMKRINPEIPRLSAGSVAEIAKLST
jgi:[acyl-carrier-protein] S-malonyltransferase